MRPMSPQQVSRLGETVLDLERWDKDAGADGGNPRCRDVGIDTSGQMGEGSVGREQGSEVGIVAREARARRSHHRRRNNTPPLRCKELVVHDVAFPEERQLRSRASGPREGIDECLLVEYVSPENGILFRQIEVVGIVPPSRLNLPFTLRITPAPAVIVPVLFKVPRKLSSILDPPAKAINRVTFRFPFIVMSVPAPLAMLNVVSTFKVPNKSTSTWSAVMIVSTVTV